MSRNTIKDSGARNRIIDEIDQNFFVEAGAGSGKTTMLVERMLAMVKAGADISQICAITFTKPAAGEFYKRFHEKLAENAETNTRCAKALQNINLCFMGTIDSFCQMILSEHPFEAELPATTVVMSDEEKNQLFNRFFFQAGRGAYGKELKELIKCFRETQEKPMYAFAAGIDVFMNNRNVNFVYSKTSIPDINIKYASEKTYLLQILDIMKTNRDKLVNNDVADSRKAWEELESVEAVAKDDWNAVFENLAKILPKFSKIRLKHTDLSSYENVFKSSFVENGKKKKWFAFNGNLNNIVEKLKNYKNELAELKDAYKYSIAMELFSKCVPHIANEMVKAGKLPYFEYLYRLRNLLKKDVENGGKLISYISKRHRYFLIDEFQDTNPLQAEIFFYLTSDKQEIEWTKCVPRKGSLFIVGDPKQSIYRFRSADVSSFILVKNLFREPVGEVLKLTSNFRSTNMLCKYFNEVFGNLLPKDETYQSAFESIPLPVQRPNEYTGVYTYSAESKGDKQTEKEDKQIKKEDNKQIGRLISKLVNNNDYLIKLREEDLPRTIRFDDIMVITKTKFALGAIIEELDRLGIPTMVEGSVPFASNEALKEIYKLYCVLANHNDRLSIYGALTGKILDCSDSEILEYNKFIAIDQLLEKPETTGTIRVKEKLNFLKDLSKKARLITPSAAFMLIMEKLPIFESVSADNLEVLYYTLELLRNAERTGTVVSLTDGQNFLKQIIEDKSGEERCLSLTDNKNCVHLANLHKVKGLQAPVVILAEASASLPKPDIRIKHGNSGAEGYIFQILGKRLPNRSAPVYIKQVPQNKDEYAEEESAFKAEQKRLIYVAATRAQDLLFICKSKKFNKENEFVDVESLWQPLITENVKEFCLNEDAQKQPDGGEVGVSTLYNEIEKETAVENKKVEDASYRISSPSTMKHSSKLSEQPTEDEVRPEMSQIVHSYPTLYGTMVHRLMELLVISKNTINTRAIVEQVLNEYLDAKYVSLESNFRTVLINIVHTMKNGGYKQANGLVQDLLSEVLSAEECYCEVPFTYKVGNGGNVEIINGIIDLLYCKENKWHIIDYKTDKYGTNLNEKHAAQLEAYITAIKEIKGLEADAQIYHIPE